MKHKFGLLCGRFQPVHRGHIDLINKALEQCDTLIIAVGSAQESRTKRNPFSYEERKEMITKCLWTTANRVIIIPIEDRKIMGDNSSWGNYLMTEIFNQTGVIPTINFSGTEAVRSHWFDEIKIKQFELDRQENPISATEVREAILADDYAKFALMTKMGLWGKYDAMQRILEEIYND